MCAMITGPIPSSPVEAPNLNALNLRLYQRITAQVMEVRGIEATLMIEGTPVVAKMPTAEQAADLLRQGSAQFVVTQLKGDGITLRQVRQDQQSGNGAVIQPRDLATRLLEALGLAKSSETMMLAQAALKQGLLVTPETLSELETALQKLGAWGQEEADLAVALKAAGLPVTAGSIQMIAGKAENISIALTQLLQQLRSAFSRGNQPPELASLMQASIRLLEKTIMNWQQVPEDLAEDLQWLGKLLGQSFEHEIAQKIENSGQEGQQESLFILGRLRKSLQQHGQPQLAEEIERFFDQIRQSHLKNVRSDPSSGRGQWVNLDVPLAVPQNEGPPVNARIRIAQRSDQENGKIDPHYTRLVIQLDLEDGGPMEVDLAFAGQQVQADITVPNMMVEELAMAEWPELQHGLNQLGYSVKTSRVDIGPVSAAGDLPKPKGRAYPYQSVDIEV